MKSNYDVAVIGGGPGGYVAAIRCARLGLSTVCIEQRETLGGTCLNVGCIPTKTLLSSTGYYDKISRDGKAMGIEASGLTANLKTMMSHKDKVVAGLTEGVAGILKRHNVDVITGKGYIASQFAIKIADSDQQIDIDNIIVATGSEPAELPFLPFDGKYVISSTEALSLQEIPKSLIIVGAGAVGLEMASIYNRLGSEVTVVEVLDTIGSGCDSAIAKMLQQSLVQQGISFSMATEVTRGKVGEGHVSLITTKDKQSTLLSGDVVIVAVGRTPNTKNLGLENIGIQPTDRGFLTVDENFRTSTSNIYAIGDVIEGPMLAHKASEEGVATAEIIAGGKASVNYLAIPNIIYTTPEVASIGLNEEEAIKAGLEITIGTFPFKANARARCSGETEGIVKVIGEKNSDRLIGMHIFGPHASELIGEGIMAIKRKATIKDIGDAVHGHPTLSEAIKEAALAAHEKAIHM